MQRWIIERSCCETSVRVKLVFFLVTSRRSGRIAFFFLLVREIIVVPPTLHRGFIMPIESREEGRSIETRFRSSSVNRVVERGRKVNVLALSVDADLTFRRFVVSSNKPPVKIIETRTDRDIRAIRKRRNRGTLIRRRYLSTIRPIPSIQKH